MIKKIVKFYEDNNRALFNRNKLLKEKPEEKENRIEELEEENSSLRLTIRYFKDKFKKLVKFLQEKLFGWGKKDPMYNKVIEDLYNNDILNEEDIKSINKDNYEL